MARGFESIYAWSDAWSRNGLVGRSSLVVTLGLATFLAACQGPRSYSPGVTDEFVNHSEDNYSQASKLLRADYMFVVDYGYSMSKSGSAPSKITAMLDSLDKFTTTLGTENIDYHLGFVRGTTHAGSVSTIATSFIAPFMTLATLGNADAQIQAQLAPVGDTLSENRNFLLESSLRTLAAQGTTFARDGSQLVLVWVSDTDDRGLDINANRTPAYYASELAKFKPSAGYINTRAIVAGADSSCAVQNYYEGAGTRLANVASLMNSATNGPKEQKTNACIYNNWDSTLNDLARNVRKPTQRFGLIERPVDSTLEVIVNGVKLSAGTGTWTYSSATNEVVFAAGKEPAPSAPITIRYQIAFTLSHAPDVSSIVITANGVEVNANSWRHIADENRIEFLSGSEPADDANIKITYQAL